MGRSMDSVDYIKQLPLRSFTAGEALLQKGDDLSFIMAIREGYIKVSSISDAGMERLIWIAGRYDFAPVEQLFTKHATARFFYTALTDGTYYEVNKSALIENADMFPSVMAEIARGMSEHYDDFLQRVDAIDGLTVRERLMKTLVYIAQRFSAGDTVDLIREGLHITHQDLANMIGSTRETTSYALNELRLSKLIDYDRKRFVIHVDQLLKTLN